jgi:hypothetical protein
MKKSRAADSPGQFSRIFLYPADIDQTRDAARASKQSLTKSRRRRDSLMRDAALRTREASWLRLPQKEWIGAKGFCSNSRKSMGSIIIREVLRGLADHEQALARRRNMRGLSDALDHRLISGLDPSAGAVASWRLRLQCLRMIDPGLHIVAIDDGVTDIDADTEGILCATSPLRFAILSGTAIEQVTASTALATRPAASPVVLTMRPLCAAMAGSTHFGRQHRR